jgi:uncharacterized protein YnzC (UPF0291/DUF896 family)
LELRQQQERLLELKRQQELVERRKRELEELNQKRHELRTGQKMLREKLTRALTLLERAEYEARREIEQIEGIRAIFREHLDEIETIDPSLWNQENLEDELTKSLSKIDHAKNIYFQHRAKADALSGQDLADEANEAAIEAEQSETALPEASFVEMVRRGFAFTLPLLVVLVILALLFLARSADGGL